MRQLVALIAVIAGLAGVATASADGEAGLVIYWGDGTVSTHCIGFNGGSISGDALLSRAGYNVNQFSGLVCGIDAIGCQHSGTFNSCTCECKTGDDDCTYWSFFQQPYGETWRYSALGIFVAEAEDGDLQGWQWGPGGPASAPAPAAITFEAVCGHPPAAVSTVPPSATVAVIATPTGGATATTPPTRGSGTSTPAQTESMTAEASAAATPKPTDEPTSGPVAPPAVPSRSPMPSPPGAGDEGEGTGAGWGAAGFVGVAGLLGAGIVAALVTRSRRRATRP